MYCQYCGAKISDDVRFCPECGRKISLVKGKKIFGSDEKKSVLRRTPYKRIILLIALGILIVTGLIFAIGRRKDNELDRQLYLGKQYLEEFDYEEAIIAFTKVIELDNKNVEAYLYRAEAYLVAAGEEGLPEGIRENYYRTAMTDYEKIQEFEPNQEDAIRGLEKVKSLLDQMRNGQEEETDTQEGEVTLAVETGRELNILLSKAGTEALGDTVEWNELLWYIFLEYFVNDDDAIRENGKQIVSKEEMDSLLMHFYGICGPEKSIDEIEYSGNAYYFPSVDYGSMGMDLVIGEDVQPQADGTFLVPFKRWYVCEEDWQTGELNEKIYEDQESYYDYSIEDAQADPFCENEQNGGREGISGEAIVKRNPQTGELNLLKYKYK